MVGDDRASSSFDTGSTVPWRGFAGSWQSAGIVQFGFASESVTNGT